MDLSELRTLDCKSLCKEIMRRPGMYVGTARLDYVQHFISGFTCAITQNDTWNPNYELQYWLLINQSACLRSLSINGWTLFYRCFGSGITALKHFSKYLHDTIPEPVGAKALAPYEVSVAYDVYSLKEQLKDKKKTFESYRSDIETLIRTLIEKSCSNYDDMRIFVIRKSLFCQIRFVYHTQDGWKDDIDIITQQENYHQIIQLHAYMECLDDNELFRLNDYSDKIYFYPNHNDDFDDINVSDIGHTVTDEISFLYKYQLWKDHFTSTY